MLYVDDNKRCNSKLKESVKEVKKISENFYDDKIKSVKEEFQNYKTICRELDELKLQNEKLERLVQELENDKGHLNEQLTEQKINYENLLKRYNDSKKLLEQSHSQNVQLSNMIEKMRDSEKQLMSENERLRKGGYSSRTDKKDDIHNNINSTTIAHLEKEMKYWKEEAEKYSKLLSKSEPTLKENVPPKKSTKKKTQSNLKRYNKPTLRSRSIESGYKKNHDEEYKKLKEEKLQMKQLLNNLENQITEIQNNVAKINEDKQRYKDMFYNNKQQLEQIQCTCRVSDSKLFELNNHNIMLSQQYTRLCHEKDELVRQNVELNETTRALEEALQNLKEDSTHQIETLTRDMKQFQTENSDLAKRSTQLNLNLQQMEVDLSKLEEEIIKKRDLIENQNVQIDSFKDKQQMLTKQLDEKSNRINNLIEESTKNEEVISRLQETDRTTNQELLHKSRQEHQNHQLIGELKLELEKQQSAFSVQIIKFENHIRNAEEIIGAKVKLITSLELKLANYDQEFVKRNEEIMEMKKQLNTMQCKLEAEQQKCEEIRGSKDVVERHLNNLIFNSDKQQREILDVNLSNNETKREIDRKSREIRDLELLLDERDQALTSYQKSLRNLEQQLQERDGLQMKMKNEMEKYNQDKTEKDKYVKSLLDIIDEKDRKMNSLQDDINSDTNRINLLNDKVNEYEDCIVHSTSRSSALELELETLRQSNSRLKKQKDQANQNLTEKNLIIGQLKAQLKSNLIGEQAPPEYAFQTISNLDRQFDNSISSKHRSLSFDENKMKTIIEH